MNNLTSRENILACPACKTTLKTVKSGQYLGCQNCKLLFPVIENIPILLLDEAVQNFNADQTN